MADLESGRVWLSNDFLTFGAEWGGDINTISTLGYYGWSEKCLNMIATSNDSSALNLNNRGAEVLAQLAKQEAGRSPKKVLVVGCGRGVEAAVLARTLDAEVVGIDLESDFDSNARKVVDLRHGDATSLEFDSGQFDMVYSYHALEHIPNYRKAISEMNRVLKDGGLYCIGTPNRSRLIGYLGSQGTSLTKKIRWNIADWRAKITGKFRNELGAHAGFTSGELASDLLDVFGNTTEITLQYYLHIYRNHQLVVNLVNLIGAKKFLFPSVYFLGRKNSQLRFPERQAPR